MSKERPGKSLEVSESILDSTLKAGITRQHSKNYVADSWSEELIGTDVMETKSLLCFQKQLDGCEHPGQIMNNIKSLCSVEKANCNRVQFTVAFSC